MEIIGPVPQALSNEDIIKRYDSSITEIIKAAADPQFDYERTILLNQARLAWMFVKGQHFNVPGQVTTPFGEIIDYQPFDITNGSDETGPDVRLSPPINVFGGDCFKFMAVMGQSSPRVKAVSDDQEDTDSLETAKNADVNIRDLWIKNKIDRKWKSLAFHQYVTGPSYLRGVWNTDARKYGQSTEPRIDVQTAEDGTLMPVVTGQTTYANGDAEIRMYSVLEIAHDYMAKDLEECGFLHCEVMRSKWELMGCYPGKPTSDEEGNEITGPGPLDKFRDQDPPDNDRTASSVTASEARDAVAVPSGTGRTQKPGFWRFKESWLAPYLFEAITDEEARKVFKEHFSRGLYVARVGSVTVDIDERCITDEWSVCKVGRGEKILERPIGADGLPIQRALNDLFGMALETVLRAITKTIMDSTLVDRESWNKNESVPAEIILTAMPADGDLTKRIFQIPPSRLSDQVLPLWQRAREIMQDVSGIRPELSGGGQPTQTFREAKQRRDQALMQLAPQADEMRYAAEGIAEILVKLRAKFGSGTVKAQRQGAYGIETDVADIAALKESGWHAEADDNFPMSLSDRRDALYSMLKEWPPQVQEALSLLDPINIGEVMELIQIPGFQSAITDQKDKTLKDVEQLLKEQAIDGPPNPDGTPGAKKPSIPMDAYDNHALVANFLGKWMISRTGQKTKLDNPGGFENVEAFFNEHQALATPPAPPPPPPVKASLSVSAKMEDFPGLTNELLVGAGLPPQPPSTGAQQPAPAPGPQPTGDLGTPAAPMAQPVPAAPEVPMNGLPPLPGGPQGPQPPGIQ